MQPKTKAQPVALVVVFVVVVVDVAVKFVPFSQRAVTVCLVPKASWPKELAKILTKLF